MCELRNLKIYYLKFCNYSKLKNSGGENCSIVISNNPMRYLISFEMLSNQNNPKTVKNNDKVSNIVHRFPKQCFVFPAISTH